MVTVEKASQATNVREGPAVKRVLGQVEDEIHEPFINLHLQHLELPRRVLASSRFGRRTFTDPREPPISIIIID